MPARLLIRPEDCSPLGREILAYIEATGISMNKLAELSGIPQPRLRGACFKGTCPTPETLRKLSRVMNRHHLELYTLAYEGRIDTVADNEADISLDLLMKEIFELARELELEPPKARPSRQELTQALKLLGFEAKTKLKIVEERS
jgi:transcriptional regulator with XRE-family HTH domain